mmetsp:Transcript_3454/g.5766  ORF Transcript_3454/g.5766 Transcript_3454/m.5766 type:complete len:214 (+) Transcript_3454:1409-2050(+)
MLVEDVAPIEGLRVAHRLVHGQVRPGADVPQKLLVVGGYRHRRRGVVDNEGAHAVPARGLEDLTLLEEVQRIELFVQQRNVVVSVERAVQNHHDAARQLLAHIERGELVRGTVVQCDVEDTHGVAQILEALPPDLDLRSRGGAGDDQHAVRGSDRRAVFGHLQRVRLALQHLQRTLLQWVIDSPQRQRVVQAQLVVELGVLRTHGQCAAQHQL